MHDMMSIRDWNPACALRHIAGHAPRCVALAALLLALAACDDDAPDDATDTATDATAADATSRPDAPDLADTPQDAPLPDVDAVPLPQGWSPAPPANRTDAQACAAWRDSAPRASTPFEPVEACEAGTLSFEARADGMRRLNFYRWLVGAPLAEEHLAALPAVQACAFYLGSNRLPLSHQPQPDAPCYQRAAADAAAVSSLAGGVNNVAEAIDLFVTDTAHRSLVVAPGLSASALGFYEGVACQLVFGDNWSWSPPFHRTLAFPAPGPNPQPPTTLFTLLPASGHVYGAAIEATVTVGDAPLAATTALVETGFGSPALEIRLGELPPVATPITVSVTGIETSAGAQAEERYTVRFVSCD